MKSKYRFIKLLCFTLTATLLFAIFSPFAAYAEENPKNILVLNSYHKGLSWTDNETEGILDTLKKSGKPYNIEVEYMDWKNYPNEDNLLNVFDYLKNKYQNKRTDMIITTDDAALQFALQNRKELFADAPVVFCGVNEQGIDALTRGYTRVTGAAEIIDPEKTIAAALEINPKLNEVYVIFDNTESGVSTGKMTMDAIARVKPGLKIKTLNDKSYGELLREVAKAPLDSAVLITTYYTDALGVKTGFEEFCQKVSAHSTVPVFHLYEFGLGNGAIGGSMLSGKLQGQSAANMALKVLQGTDISKLPIDMASKTRFVFDYHQLERFHISERSLPEGSEIINKPFSFFEAYKALVILALIIFCLLVAFILILTFYLRKISRMNIELENSHQELKESDDMLKAQFAEFVSVQETLVSSEKRYSILFEKMLNGYFVFEPVLNESGKLVDMRFLYINPGFSVQTGIDAAGMVGKTWTEIFQIPNKELNYYHNVLKTGETEHFEISYGNPEKSFSLNAFKISDRQIGVVFDNITMYKQAIKEKTRMNEELEHRVMERTQELQDAVSELESFTYTVSHDLKSPLRAIQGYSRIMMEDYGPELPEDGKKIIQNVRNISGDMIEMVSKLLEYATKSKADIVKEPILIEELFLSIFSELKSANPDRSLRLLVETGLPKVYADRVMLRQVIYNILSNAVKFTRYKETAMIQVGCTITGQEYVFYVKDNGSGFNEEYAHKLFGIFQRLHTVDEFEGSGIGLVTVKKLIQKHGGQVWIEGMPDMGATVYFTLPFN